MTTTINLYYVFVEGSLLTLAPVCVAVFPKQPVAEGRLISLSFNEGVHLSLAKNTSEDFTHTH